MVILVFVRSLLLPKMLVFKNTKCYLICVVTLQVTQVSGHGSISGPNEVSKFILFIDLLSHNHFSRYGVF